MMAVLRNDTASKVWRATHRASTLPPMGAAELCAAYVWASAGVPSTVVAGGGVVTGDDVVSGRV